MAAKAPPRIFSSRRRAAARLRARRLRESPAAARYIAEDMAEDVIERLDFLRFSPSRALVIGDLGGTVGEALRLRGVSLEAADPSDGFDEERPFAGTGFDLIASLGTLDTVNDLPGALLHIRNALAPGGLMIASFMGAGSLPALRAAMLAADGERPAPRLHPMVDVRAGGELLQRTGFADPVIDSRPLDVRFSSLASLLADLRAQALGNVLADPGPPLGKAALALLREGFASGTVERFEILTLSGWRR